MHALGKRRLVLFTAEVGFSEGIAEADIVAGVGIFEAAGEPLVLGIARVGELARELTLLVTPAAVVAAFEACPERALFGISTTGEPLAELRRVTLGQHGTRFGVVRTEVVPWR
jgi:hypothetical protein